MRALSPVVARAMEARPGKGSLTVKAEALSMTLSIANESAGDAPPCDVCGTITVRSGTCYKCLNCGASLGCS
jgi:ribonucleoside-diphosphate reductase alpha chain